MATKIFLNNVWQDYDYEYLYNNLGVTRTKSKNIVAYDSSMNEISGWYNSGYNWIIRDNQWYSSDTTPYFVKQNSSVSFYRIDKEIIFPVYKKNDEEFILKDGAFINSQSLLDDYGYTQTPSTVWDIDNAIPWSWYNSDLNEYWDDREGYKYWSPDPPDVSCPIPEEDMIFTGTDTLIMPDDDFILCVNTQIDVNFGDRIIIPEGYTVESVQCGKLFVPASNITYSGQTISFEYLGENEFCDDINKALFGNQVNPCIEMFGFSNVSSFQGFRLSVDSTRSGIATAVSATNLNSDGYFVKGSATLSSNYNLSTYVNYMQTNPMMFRLYVDGTLVPYHFTIQHSVWQVVDGVFSLVGDDTDVTDLAYWYKSAPNVRVNLAPI